MLKNPNPMEARTGRDKQMYKEGSIRQVAGCVPINRVTKEILLITRRKKEGGWVLPKGGWENDETEREAAARETYEEAGARGRVTSFIGVWDHDVNKSTGLPKAIFSFFEMEVDRLEERWPEMDERDRQWFSYEDALKALIKPFMREVIEHCSLAPLSPPSLLSNNNNNRRFSSRKLESQQQKFLKNKLIRPPSPSPSSPTTLSPKLVTINTTQLPTSPPSTSFLLSPTSLSSRNIKSMNSSEEHKDVLIWRFSVFIIILSIFFWYFTAKNNNNNNNNNFSSFFSITNED